jgi:molybdenum cofactor cytidylyltransferase
MRSVGVMILAAGASSRFGTPKQLAHFQGQTLIRRAVDAALGSECRPIVVVLGANAEVIAPQVTGPVEIRTNADWNSGMGSSIRCGLSAIEAEVDAVIIVLCDQPLITSEALKRLAKAADQRLVAAEYGNSVGVPALFGREFFPSLRALKENCGAKQILTQNLGNVTRLKCQEAAVDIDTLEDLMRWGGPERKAVPEQCVFL